MIKHIKLWREWAKHCTNSWSYKIAVLFKLANSPTFEAYKVFSVDDIRKFGKFREWESTDETK